MPEIIIPLEEQGQWLPTTCLKRAIMPDGEDSAGIRIASGLWLG